MAPEVIEWFLGEQTRGIRETNRKTNLGIFTIDVGADAPTDGELRPQSCAPGLVSFIPTPTRTGTWFGVDEEGHLLRYAGEGWTSVPSTVPIPSISKLLATSDAASPLELLVAVKRKNSEYLSVLVIANDEVTAVQDPDPSTLGDREAALFRFDSGRCIDDVHDCLHLTKTADGLMLMLEPELYGNRNELTTLDKDGVHDVRYADVKGTKIDVLTTHACVSLDDPSPESETPP